MSIVCAGSAIRAASSSCSGRRTLLPTRRGHRTCQRRGLCVVSVSAGNDAADTIQPHVAVVGAGWGGWAAAKALCESGVKVTLLDGLPDPTGATPYLTPTGKPFEAGTRGFWKDYPNIEDLVAELGLSEEDIFTEFTPSSFFSPNGLEATAPVFSSSSFPELPSPLGQVFATFDNFKRLPVSDRVTMLGLLYAMLDLNRDQETFEAYDRMTAHELFIRMGLSKRLVDDFVRPTLLVGLFKPPEELSAAVAMELLYYYALAHQTSFDVRWIKGRSIAETIIQPLADRISSTCDIDVKGGCRVQKVHFRNGMVSGLQYTDPSANVCELDDIDACVLALGANGMKAVMRNSPEMSRICPELAAAASLGSIDVLATRIWLDRIVPTDTPANVFSQFSELRGAGGTFFMLDQLQPDKLSLWGGQEPQGSVLACDFYNSGAVASLSDDDIVKLLMEKLLPAAVPGFANAKVVDSYVQRYPGAVTWFSPGSFPKRPPLQTTVPNLVCAGDWVRMGDKEHGAKGLCQERAYVSGLEAAENFPSFTIRTIRYIPGHLSFISLGIPSQRFQNSGQWTHAANALLRSGIFGAEHSRKLHEVIPIREDEPQVKLGRDINARLMGALKPLGLDSPWVR